MYGMERISGVKMRLDVKMEIKMERAIKAAIKSASMVWVGTVIKNFPMALLWNLFAAGPVSRLVIRTCFKGVGEKRDAAPECTAVSEPAANHA